MFGTLSPIFAGHVAKKLVCPFIRRLRLHSFRWSRRFIWCPSRFSQISLTLTGYIKTFIYLSHNRLEDYSGPLPNRAILDREWGSHMFISDRHRDKRRTLLRRMRRSTPNSLCRRGCHCRSVKGRTKGRQYAELGLTRKVYKRGLTTNID